MRFTIILLTIIIASSAHAEFTCEKDGDSCPGKLCIKDTPDQCVNGLVAEQKNGTVILKETTPGTAVRLKSLLNSLQPYP